MLYSHTVGMAMAKGGQALRSGMSRLGSGKRAAGKAEAAGAGGREAGRFGGKRAGDSVMRDSKKPGFGTRLKNTTGLAHMTARNLSATAGSIKKGNFKEAAKSGLKSIDGMSNMRRVYRGQEAKAGIGERLRNRYNNTVEAAVRGSDMLSGSIEKTRGSVIKGAHSLQNAYETFRKPGSTRSEVFGSLAAAGRDIYSARKDFSQTRRDLGAAVGDFRGAIHRVDAGGSTLSMDYNGKVLAREFDGMGIFSRPPEKAPVAGAGPGGIQVNIDRGLSQLESALGGLESASSGGGSAGSGSGSGSGYGRTSASGGASDSRRAGTVPWTSATVNRSQIRCTSIPAVQKVSGSGSGGKVTYQSLSVKGLSGSGSQGKGTITRRNSI